MAGTGILQSGSIFQSFRRESGLSHDLCIGCELTYNNEELTYNNEQDIVSIDYLLGLSYWLLSLLPVVYIIGFY